MKIAAIMMVRNEADIWRESLTRATRLFDHVFVVDHQSTDGTLEITQDISNRSSGIQVFTYRYRAYLQSQLSNSFARLAFNEGADWVFYLDGDEFLKVPSREELDAIIRESNAEVLRFRWANLVPSMFGNFETFDLRQTFHWSGKMSNFGKVAFCTSFAGRNPDFHVQQGNHAVSASRQDDPSPMFEAGVIHHLPVRSLERLRYKVDVGVQAYEAKRGRLPTEGEHWFELQEKLQRGSLERNWVASMISQYGEPLQSINSADPKVEGWPSEHLYLEDGLACDIKSASLAETIVRDRQCEWRPLGLHNDAPIQASILSREVVLCPQPVKGSGKPGPARFLRLPPSTPSEGAKALSLSELVEALACSFRPISTLVDTAWANHVPFLFSLFCLQRPRRYVELGTYKGMSFFAACQAAERLNDPTECVAIDSWDGDVQSGIYGGNVFNVFSNIAASRHPDGLYIRSLFKDAAGCFDDHSIDLLHIDGLHTYEAVKYDYLTWLPKMSDNGVMILHDVAEYGGDFGVWRLWSELERMYPSFIMPHCHGLGIAYVGSKPSPFGTLIREACSDDGMRSLINCFYTCLGALSFERAELEARLAAAQPSSCANQSLANGFSAQQELDRFQQELDRLRCENQTLRSEADRAQAEAYDQAKMLGAVWNSTSWKITWPIRLAGRSIQNNRFLRDRRK